MEGKIKPCPFCGNITAEHFFKEGYCWNTRSQPEAEKGEEAVSLIKRCIEYLQPEANMLSDGGALFAQLVHFIDTYNPSPAPLAQKETVGALPLNIYIWI